MFLSGYACFFLVFLLFFFFFLFFFFSSFCPSSRLAVTAAPFPPVLHTQIFSKRALDMLFAEELAGKAASPLARCVPLSYRDL